MQLSRSATRRWLVALLWTALPATWFAVRDAFPLLEWVAILLPLLAVAGVVALLLLARALRSRAPVWGAVSLCLVSVFAVVWPWTPTSWPEPAPAMTLLTANVLAENAEPARAAQDLLDVNADVVVLQEVVPGRQDQVLAAMDAAYPFGMATPDGVGVWSRYELRASPPSGGELPQATRGLRVVVEGPAGPFALYALHLYRPSRDAYQTEVTVEQQRDLVAELDRVVDADPLPAVLAGDLNLTDRSAAYRVLADGRRDAQRADWAAPTGLRARNWPLLLRIDHVLMPGDWCSGHSRRLPVAGSDHRAVAVSIGPCP